MEKHILTTPISEEDVRALQVGDVVYLRGTVYTGRDMAHLKIQALLEEHQSPPCDLRGAALFHAGPVALRDNKGDWKLNVIGPTTSIRMEPYADMVGQLGVRAVIGKGGMAEKTVNACQHYGYVYLQAAPGCAALLARGIEAIDGVGWLEFGMPEAMWNLRATEFGPLVVGIDTHGHSIYQRLKQAAQGMIDNTYPVVG